MYSIKGLKTTYKFSNDLNSNCTIYKYIYNFKRI